MSRPCGCCCDNGPGVLPAPGDRTSSFTAPLYDNEELGGLCRGGGEDRTKNVSLFFDQEQFDD